MKLISATLAALALLAVPYAAWAHDPSAQEPSPAPLNDASIIVRLQALGFSNVAIVQAHDGVVDVQMQRQGRTYALTVSRSLFGPRSLAAYDTQQFVEREIRPVDSLRRDPIERRPSPGLIPQ